MNIYIYIYIYIYVIIHTHTHTHTQVLDKADFELLQPRTLFLRSVDAALECMLIYFGMESTYLYDADVAGKRCLCRFGLYMYMCMYNIYTYIRYIYI